MKHRIEELIDIPQLQKLMEDLYQATGINHALIDVESNVLSAVGWQKICTDFHRVHPVTCARCLESDKYILSHLQDSPYAGYHCPQGLTDYCTPVIIEGEHLANLFTGQMLHEPPDVAFFRKQAAEFGFDEASYLSALNEVRIIPKERMPGVMAFLQDLAQMLAASGMERLRILESEKRLKALNETLEARVAERTEKLQVSETNLRRAQRVAGIGSWTLDIPKSHLVWHEEIYRLFDFATNTPLTLTDFFALIHPDDREAVGAAWQAALDGAPYDIEHRIVVGGEVKWVHEQAEMEFDAGGNACFAVGTVRNITERKRAEEQLRSERDFVEGLVNTAPTIVLVLDTQGRIVRLNPYMEAISGYAFAEVQGKDWFSTFLPKSKQEQTKALFLKAIDNIQTVGNEDVIVTRDGRERIIEWNDKTLKDIEGHTLGLLAIGQDVTERKLAEQELKRSNAELEQFSYAISHDMRQPLRMISSYLQLLEKRLAGQLDGDKREFFDFAIDGAQRLDKMLLALLEYSRVGRKGEPPEWIESRALLDEALRYLQPAIAEAQAEVKITGDWPRVFVSRDEMMRLIQNLIGNAVKYRVAGRKPEIIVHSETIDKEWRLSVSDNGVGILPNQIHRLFQVFQRLQTRAAYEGAGIGLALCRKIAEHHGGHITAESAGEGLGSSFCVRLPIRREKSACSGKESP